MFYIYLRSYRVVRSFIRNICKFTFNFADYGPPFYITNYDVGDRRSFSFDTRVLYDEHREMPKRDVGRENKFLSKISRRMEIGHGASLSVTAGSVPADLHLSSKGLFFMFELNCPRQRALSTLVEVMIAILKRELADVSTNFELRWLLPSCFVSTLRYSWFFFFFCSVISYCFPCSHSIFYTPFSDLPFQLPPGTISNTLRVWYNVKITVWQNSHYGLTSTAAIYY